MAVRTSFKAHLRGQINPTSDKHSANVTYFLRCLPVLLYQVPAVITSRQNQKFTSAPRLASKTPEPVFAARPLES
jgi:hypothetical protein